VLGLIIIYVMEYLKRRNFLRLSGLTGVSVVVGGGRVLGAGRETGEVKEPALEVVTFTDDGVFYDPAAYLNKLQEIGRTAGAIGQDFYGHGGAVEQLEKRFAAITGKEAAICMPTGTLANQLAISVLSGENTKVFVQETSHIYRDEADAAQSVFGKRLMPLARGEAFFTLEDLQAAIEYTNREEVFKSGIGAIAIENPVRRNDGKVVPLREIKRISAFCKSNGYKLHLDGARLYLASAFSGVSIQEYSSYFDTVYISLYKYLGAHGGAVLCGDKAVIDKMEHLVKVHGGTVFSNWSNAAMALHHLEGLDERLKQSASRAKDLFQQLNALPGIEIKALNGGSNIYDFKLRESIDPKQFAETLSSRYKIVVPWRKTDGVIKLRVNETLLRRDVAGIVKAFAETVK